MYYALRILAIVVLSNVSVLLINIPNDFTFYGAFIPLGIIFYLVYQVFKHLKTKFK
jgi:hypothetical protein